MNDKDIVQLLLRLIKLQDKVIRLEKDLEAAQEKNELIKNNWNQRYGKLEEKYERLQASR